MARMALFQHQKTVAKEGKFQRSKQDLEVADRQFSHYQFDATQPCNELPQKVGIPFTRNVQKLAYDLPGML